MNIPAEFTAENDPGWSDPEFVKGLLLKHVPSYSGAEILPPLPNVWRCAVASIDRRASIGERCAAAIAYGQFRMGLKIDGPYGKFPDTNKDIRNRLLMQHKVDISEAEVGRIINGKRDFPPRLVDKLDAFSKVLIVDSGWLKEGRPSEPEWIKPYRDAVESIRQFITDHFGSDYGGIVDYTAPCGRWMRFCLAAHLRWGTKIPLGFASFAQAYATLKDQRAKEVKFTMSREYGRHLIDHLIKYADSLRPKIAPNDEEYAAGYIEGKRIDYDQPFSPEEMIVRDLCYMLQRDFRDIKGVEEHFVLDEGLSDQDSK